MKRLVAMAVALCAFAFAACLAGCAENDDAPKYQVVSEGKLTVAMSAEFPPFESLDGETPTGFDVSVAHEVANRLGLQLDIQVVPFDDVVQGVHDGAYDAGISALSINPSRSELVDFTSPYYLADQAVVCKKGASSVVSDLKGKRIAAQAETTGYDYAEENVSSSVVAYSTLAECFAALEVGDVAAVVADEPAARFYMANAYSDCAILETVATCEKYAVAVNKNNRGLTDAINNVLAEMEKDGTLTALQKQVG